MNAADAQPRRGRRNPLRPPFGRSRHTGSVRQVAPGAQIPSYKDLLWPTLRAVREIGDSGTIEEIVEKVIELEGFTEQQQSVPHGEGPSSEIEYRLAWARTYLKGMGALINSTRGVWSTTEFGRNSQPSKSEAASGVCR